ncbi:hypothetical protein FM037_17150 [Shewanella psychropiezotolerans]|uniref:Lipoprotein n=1 Tax=Shewanella psychropiezotolerans TaxID=2593655 RepID=A0ABX5WZU4_9GAMM|nr:MULTISPECIES: hypothetical protein [Shewanella]MPY26216.1 hypothetical protein [Shewanella sp. YLB-07]QDO84625.1 hypothetical protein FM037_17150 [Shewanella psychropiezotolerans]
MNKIKPLMSMVISLMAMIQLCGCENQSQLEMDPVQIKVAEAVKEAELLGDYRLYATTGRRMTLPGISMNDNQQAKALCGVQYMIETGDVISTEEQRDKRKYLIDFMTSYNQVIFEKCKKLLIEQDHNQ